MEKARKRKRKPEPSGLELRVVVKLPTLWVAHRQRLQSDAFARN